MAILIKSGLVVHADGSQQLDVLVEDGHIGELAPNIPPEGHEIIDAQGCLVLPGLVDMSVRPVDAGDTRECSLAALAGGTTTIALRAPLENLAHGIHSACDYTLHAELTRWDKQTAELMDKAAGHGVCSFFLDLFAHPFSDAEMLALMRKCAALGAPLYIACESAGITAALEGELRPLNMTQANSHQNTRPDVSEAAETARALHFADLAGATLIISRVSCEKSVAEIRKARKNGQAVYLETCPQYLALDNSLFVAPPAIAAKYVCSPPLRGMMDIAALWEAARRGEVDVISSDHFAAPYSDKKRLCAQDYREIPCGLPGAQERPLVAYNFGVLDGRITENQFVRLLAENPARLLGLYPQKGVLAVGADADIVVWDRYKKDVLARRKLAGSCDYTPYENLHILGGARAVLARGLVCALEGTVTHENEGHFVRTKKPDLWREAKKRAPTALAGSLKQSLEYLWNTAQTDAEE